MINTPNKISRVIIEHHPPLMSATHTGRATE